MHTPAPIAKKHKLNTQLLSGFTPPFVKVQCFQRRAGFTLIEVIVSSVLIGITLLSLANLFVAGKRHILHSRSRMAGGELGRAFLDPLQMDVREDTWGTASNCLTNAPAGCPSPQTFDNITYTPTYNIDDINMGGVNNNLRRVRLTISWNEPT